jgi:hypothetical protein
MVQFQLSWNTLAGPNSAFFFPSSTLSTIEYTCFMTDSSLQGCRHTILGFLLDPSVQLPLIRVTVSPHKFCRAFEPLVTRDGTTRLISLGALEFGFDCTTSVCLYSSAPETYISEMSIVELVTKLQKKGCSGVGERPLNRDRILSRTHHVLARRLLAWHDTSPLATRRFILLLSSNLSAAFASPFSRPHFPYNHHG